MLGVRRAEIHGINFLQAALVIVVTGAYRNAVLVAELVELLDTAAHDGMEGGVTPRVRKRWQHRGLSDVTKPDHCVANLRLSHFEPPPRPVQAMYQRSLLAVELAGNRLEIFDELLTSFFSLG